MPKEIDVAALELGGLENLIGNHRARGATNSPTYLTALRELERRKGGGLDFDKSFTLIREAARQGNFLSYKQLADASGTNWAQVRYAIGGHLWRLVEYAHRMGWPMLSAIVVNKPNVASGRMEPETIKGFIAAARDLGYSVTSEQDFLRQQQKLVFEWARSA